MTNDAIETASRLLHSARPTRKVSIDQSDLQELIDVAISIQAEKDAAVAAEREACVSRLESLKDTAYQNNFLAEGVTYSCAIDAIRARANPDALAEHDARVRTEALGDAAKIAFSCDNEIEAHDAIIALIPDTDEV